jgi:hypothetical protein
MAVIKRKRSAEFAIIPNAIAANNNLSFDARGLLVYLLSRPNDWKVLAKNIQSEGGIGRDKAYRLLNELIDAGYVEKREMRGSGSRFTHVSYIVRNCILPKAADSDNHSKTEPAELCAVSAASGFSGSGNSDSGKSGPNTKKGRIQRTDSPLPPNDEGEEMWNQIVGMWPEQHLPRSLRAAKAVFVKLSSADKEAAHKYCFCFLVRSHYVQRDALLIPYLKSKAWQEFIDPPPSDPDGYHIIEPFRPEWQDWIDYLEETKGPDAVDGAKRQGRILAKRRWPTDASP